MSNLPYLCHINVKSTRFIRDVDIDLPGLPGQAFRNLVLTGKNGAGKTSVLSAIHGELVRYVHNTPSSEVQIAGLQQNIAHIQKLAAAQGVSPQQRTVYAKQISDLEGQIAQIRKQPSAELAFTGPKEAMPLLLRGNRIIRCFLGAGRAAHVAAVSGPSKELDSQVANQNNSFASQFAQFLVNKRTMQAYAREDDDHHAADDIKRWFFELRDIFRQIFSDDRLEIRFRREAFRFEFELGDGRLVGLNELSDGYSGALAILAEIMIRWDYLKRHHPDFDGEGIVLIDEVETHLHLELQRSLMPLLQHLYPKIQFIVATHSPAVIASMDNALVYDLSRRIAIEGAIHASRMGVVAREALGLSSEYSLKVSERFSRARALLWKTSCTTEETEELRRLITELERMSPELSTQFQLEMARRAEK